ncbi:MAG: RNA polymerase sigma factor [Phycisphaerales bacterium]|nr:MAG: RNA polymerase sigma factor [Phycisphaerales bacterium]
MEDKLLIWKCKRGDRDALRRIYEKYHADLLKLAIILTDQAHSADDIVHDVFVQFARSVPRISLTGSLKGYLIASTVNRVRNLHRDRCRRNKCGLGQATAQPAASAGPDHWAIMGEQLERLSGAMAQLPYEQREVITLRMQAGLTFRNIARWQKTSISTVQGRYRYGLDKLRSLIDGERSK